MGRTPQGGAGDDGGAVGVTVPATRTVRRSRSCSDHQLIAGLTDDGRASCTDPARRADTTAMSQPAADRW